MSILWYPGTGAEVSKLESQSDRRDRHGTYQNARDSTTGATSLWHGCLRASLGLCPEQERGPVNGNRRFPQLGGACPMQVCFCRDTLEPSEVRHQRRRFQAVYPLRRGHILVRNQIATRAFWFKKNAIPSAMAIGVPFRTAQMDCASQRTLRSNLVAQGPLGLESCVGGEWGSVGFHA